MSLTTLYESDEVESIIAPQKPEKRSSVDSTTSTTSTSSWGSSTSSSSRMKRLSARFSGLFGGSKRSSMQSMAGPPPATIRRSSSTPGLSSSMSDETSRNAPVVTPSYLAGLANFDYDSFGPTPRKAGKWRAQDQWRPEDLQGNYAIM